MARRGEMMVMMQMMTRRTTTFTGFLFRNLKGYRFWIVLAGILTVIQVGSDVLIAFPFKFILDKIVSHKDPSILTGLVTFFDRFGTTAGLRPGETHTVLGVILFSVFLLVVLNVVNAITTYLQNSIASIVGKNLTARLRKELFAQIQRLTLDWHNKQRKGDIVQRITTDIAAIERLVTDGLIEILTGIFTLLACLIVLFLISYQFALLFVVVVPALVLIVFSYTSSTRIAIKRAVMAAGEVANVAAEDIGAIDLIKAFTIEDREASRFTRYVTQDRMATVRAGELQAQLSPVLTVLVALATAIIIGVGAYVATGNTFTFWFLTIPKDVLTIGSLTVFLAYLGKLYSPLRGVARLTTLGVNATAGAERIQEVFDQAPEVLETAIPYSGPTKLNGEITFDKVIFNYMPERPVLKGIDVHIPAGRKVGVVGLSGGGKTTLIKLIPRFYEVQQGAVMIDGKDNRSYPLALLRQNISLVLQESILFEGTIRENIALGRPDASDEQVIEAAKQAYIHEVIMSLPDGYNTMVRERGSNFSGGQRQRLAIARAILRDAPILILDEPTASLDVEAEAQVTRALDQLIVGRTVLLISHRLSTLGNVDEIIVLKDGRIAERGTFQELKQLGGLFSGFLAEQNRYNLDRTRAGSIMRPVERRFADATAKTIVRRKPQPMLQGRLFIEVDGKKVGEHQLDKSMPVLTIGSLPDNDIVISARSISSRHARLRWLDGMLMLEDMESLNGVMYQGERVDQLVLADGDRVNLAPKVVLQFAGAASSSNDAKRSSEKLSLGSSTRAVTEIRSREGGQA